MTDQGPVLVSVVIPMFNEQGNVALLHQKIVAAMEPLGRSFEIICVNDGSTDQTEQELRRLAAQDPRLKVVNLRRNYGQTAALMAAIDHSRGGIILPMDGDLQNDPEDIGKLLLKIDEGYDVVSGWRVDRQDNTFERTIPSRIANALIAFFTGVRLHDLGCALKAYRREILDGIRLYGEMHRFIAIFASWHGGRICEVPVKHHARVSGEFKYGLGRIYKVLLDLAVVKFLIEYNTRPIHVFGAVGVLSFVVSLLSGGYAVYLKLLENTSFIQTPMPLLSVFAFITGLMCLLLGLLAEILIRIYFETQHKVTYTVRSRINLTE